MRVPQVEGERRAGVHEDAVATTAHKERDGLVHVGCLGAIRVVGPEHQLLAALVQAGKGLPATEQLLPRRETEAGRDVPVERGRVADKREGRRPGVDHAGGIGEVVRAGQEPSRSVPELEAHRVLIHDHLAAGPAVGHGRSPIARPPGAIGRRLVLEHERRFPAASFRPGGQPEAHRARGHEREVERERAVVLVLSLRQILPDPVVLELGRDLMVGDPLLEREALPAKPPGSTLRVELLDPVADEEVVLLPGELLAHVHRLVLKDNPELSHKPLPSCETVFRQPSLSAFSNPDAGRKRTSPPFDATRKRANDRKKRVRRPRGRKIRMPEDQHRQQDPTQQYPQPEYPEQTQMDQHPGLEQEMQPEPDYGLDTYRGSGKLEGKKAIITGADSGIGRAVALAFAREGADVLISYLSENADARETVRLVEAEGRRAIPVAGDLVDEAHCRALVERARDEFGRVDVLVNNAAFQVRRESIDEIPTDEWERTLATNLSAMFWLCREAVPAMEPGASIINVASIQASQPSASLLAYATTKGGIVTFSKALSAQLIGRGIRVNVVAPGPVWTPLVIATSSPEDNAQFGSQAPIGRPAQPAELAPSFVFLASPESTYITGEVIAVTGGEFFS